MLVLIMCCLSTTFSACYFMFFVMFHAMYYGFIALFWFLKIGAVAAYYMFLAACWLIKTAFIVGGVAIALITGCIARALK